ncbi:MAG: hypothetical protein JHC93_08160 [Parachlamydiales bacterium]|nr:hypothetical protein [Parachlamydiales bacterium]
MINYPVNSIISQPNYYSFVYTNNDSTLNKIKRFANNFFKKPEEILSGLDQVANIGSTASTACLQVSNVIKKAQNLHPFFITSNTFFNAIVLAPLIYDFAKSIKNIVEDIALGASHYCYHHFFKSLELACMTALAVISALQFFEYLNVMKLAHYIVTPLSTGLFYVVFTFLIVRSFVENLRLNRIVKSLENELSNTTKSSEDIVEEILNFVNHQENILKTKDDKIVQFALSNNEGLCHAAKLKFFLEKKRQERIKQIFTSEGWDNLKKASELHFNKTAQSSELNDYIALALIQSAVKDIRHTYYISIAKTVSYIVILVIFVAMAVFPPAQFVLYIILTIICVVNLVRLISEFANYIQKINKTNGIEEYRFINQYQKQANEMLDQMIVTFNHFGDANNLTKHLNSTDKQDLLCSPKALTNAFSRFKKDYLKSVKAELKPFVQNRLFKFHTITGMLRQANGELTRILSNLSDYQVDNIDEEAIHLSIKKAQDLNLIIEKILVIKELTFTEFAVKVALSDVQIENFYLPSFNDKSRFTELRVA